MLAGDDLCDRLGERRTVLGLPGSGFGPREHSTGYVRGSWKRPGMRGHEPLEPHRLLTTWETTVALRDTPGRGRSRPRPGAHAGVVRYGFCSASPTSQYPP